MSQVLENKIFTFLENKVGFEFFSPDVERSIDRVRPYFQNLIQKLNQPLVVTVGGTNGKGQTIHHLAAYLKAHKITYTMWTSPHIQSITERFISDGKQIDHQVLWEEIQKTFGHIENTIKLSYYEFLFSCFLSWSEKINPQVVLLEVGLGGRLDAVNFLDAHITCITSIGRDHQKILGNSMAKILKEKMGILREGQKFFSALKPAYLRNQVSQNLKFPIHWKDLYEEKLLLANDGYQKSNSMLAELMMQEIALKLSTPFVPQKITPKTFKGRFDAIEWSGNIFYFQGAHNLDSFRESFAHNRQEALLKTLDGLLLSFTQRDERELESMLTILVKNLICCTEKNVQVFFSDFEHFKAYPSASVLNIIESSGKIPKDSTHLVMARYPNWKDLIGELGDQKILVTGSMYFVGQVQNHLLQLGGTYLPPR